VGSDELLRVEGLKVHFPIKRGVFFDRTVGHVRAVDGVDLAVPRGSTYGLVGESGCGKSTLGRAILRLIEPTAGRVLFDGTDVAALEGEPLRHMRQRMQMVFQDPLGSLDPRQNVESLITEPLRAHGLGGNSRELTEKVSSLLDAVGLPAAARRRYPHEFSGGQRQRIGIARALASDPELLVCDEATSALDVSVQAQVLKLLRDLQAERQLAYIVISHNLGVVREISSEVVVMRSGRVVESGPTQAVLAGPAQPYTRALRRAALDPTTMRGRKPRALVSAIVTASAESPDPAMSPGPAT
jgi:peptide/nickel transport system ATP-binding protein